MHKFSVSALPTEREIYEHVAMDEEAFLPDDVKEVLQEMPQPRGWHKQSHPGRPRKNRRGPKGVFTRQSIVLVLLLKAFQEFTY